MATIAIAARRICRRGSASRRRPAALATVGIRAADAPFDLLSLYTGGPRELDRYGGDALDPDRRPHRRSSIQRRAASTAGPATTTPRPSGRWPATGLPAVRDALDAATDASWASRGAMQLKAEAFELAYEAFRRAVTLNSRNAEALAGLSDAAAGARKQDEDAELAEGDRGPRARATRRSASSWPACSRPTGDCDRPPSRPRPQALRLAPDDPRAAEQLASIFADAGDADRLAPLAASLAARFPDRPDPRYYRPPRCFCVDEPKRRLRPSAASSTATPITRARRTCSARRAPRWAGASARRRRSKRRCGRTRAIRRPT